MYSRRVVNFVRSQKHARRRLYRKSASGLYSFVDTHHPHDINSKNTLCVAIHTNMAWHGSVDSYFCHTLSLISSCCWRQGRPGRGREYVLNCGVPFGRIYVTSWEKRGMGKPARTGWVRLPGTRYTLFVFSRFVLPTLILTAMTQGRAAYSYSQH